jgi:hypothetical protein
VVDIQLRLFALYAAILATILIAQIDVGTSELYTGAWNPIEAP